MATVPAGFNISEVSPESHLASKKVIVDFKLRGHGGEVGHLVNHRVVTLPNSSQITFETCLRESKFRPLKASKGQESLPAFNLYPHLERKPAASFVMLKKDFDKARKNLHHLEQRRVKEFTGTTGKREVLYPAE